MGFKFKGRPIEGEVKVLMVTYLLIKLTGLGLAWIWFGWKAALVILILSFEVEAGHDNPTD